MRRGSDPGTRRDGDGHGIYMARPMQVEVPAVGNSAYTNAPASGGGLPPSPFPGPCTLALTWNLSELPDCHRRENLLVPRGRWPELGQQGRGLQVQPAIPEVPMRLPAPLQLVCLLCRHQAHSQRGDALAYTRSMGVAYSPLWFPGSYASVLVPLWIPQGFLPCSGGLCIGGCRRL